MTADLDAGHTVSIIWYIDAALNLDADTSFRGNACEVDGHNAMTSSVCCGHLYAMATLM